MKMNISMSAAAFLAFSSVALAGGGVKGKIVFGGATVPAVADLSGQIKGHQDADICTSPKMKAEDMVVDPATKGIQWAFVSIEKVTGGKTLQVPAEPIVSDQKSCHFEPHILVVPKGAKVQLKNSDTKLHNTHSWSQKNPAFNEGIPAGNSITKEFKDVEKVKLTCDVHPWMKGYIVVTDTPYYAVTGADGSYEIGDLPAGKYTVKVWHETFGNAKQEIEVKDGAAVEQNVTMTPKAGG